MTYSHIETLGIHTIQTIVSEGELEEGQAILEVDNDGFGRALEVKARPNTLVENDHVLAVRVSQVL